MVGGGGWRPTLGEWATLGEWTWCHCWVPLQGAIVVCYGWGGGWRPTLGEWTWCHCSVCYGWGGGWRPSLGEWTFHCRVPVAPYTAMASRKSIQKSCLELLADVTRFSTLMTQKLVFAIWGLCWYNQSFFQFFSTLDRMIRNSEPKKNSFFLLLGGLHWNLKIIRFEKENHLKPNLHDLGFQLWWQLKYFLFSSRNLGKDEPILTSIFFKGGWFNHQLVKV